MKLAICTKNATHGGVEALVALHQDLFAADVFVCGGMNQPDLTPFRYTYCETPEELRKRLGDGGYNCVEYHWLWAPYVEVLKDTRLPLVEVVHRLDTAECDKTVPHVLVTHSQFIADALAPQCGRDFVVVGNAIDVDRFDLQAIQRPKVIGALTRYDPSKGMDMLLRAWFSVQADLKDTSIRLYGDGPWAEYLQRMTVVLGLRDVDLRGPITGPENYLPEFGVVVSPSRCEGMPIAIQEALACNLPVIATALPGMVEFNQRAFAELGYNPLTLFEPENISEFAECLRHYDDDGARRSTRDYIRRHYGKEVHAARMREVYDTALVRCVTKPAPAPAPTPTHHRQIAFTVGGVQPTVICLGRQYCDDALLAWLAGSGWNVVTLDTARATPRSITENWLTTPKIGPKMVSRPLVVLVCDATYAETALSLNAQYLAYVAHDGQMPYWDEYLRQYADVTLQHRGIDEDDAATATTWHLFGDENSGYLARQLHVEALRFFAEQGLPVHETCGITEKESA